MINKIRGVLFGHAVADALGVPVEFLSREELDKNPLCDMIGYGTYNMPQGCWSDDTSMAIAALDSLKDGEVNFDKIMCNFSNWLLNGEYTPTGKMFDVGGTCKQAILNYSIYEKSPLECGLNDSYSNGNGSLMRIYPFVLYAYINGISGKKLDVLINNASSLTHRHERSCLGCRIYALILTELLKAPSKDSVLKTLSLAKESYKDSSQLHYYGRIFEDDFPSTPRDEIESDGYVVHTLEATLWCIFNTSSYEDCVLKAVNLGSDTDTTAAVCGSLAGALYGYDSIPEKWLASLKRRDYLDSLCKDLLR